VNNVAFCKSIHDDSSKLIEYFDFSYILKLSNKIGLS